ncbi:MAG: TonB-dependent receptor [Haliscomenobacter sp.]|uniref:TonB-dependent receptor n=1 Tax=Haliscomenobacter sp. TaxID=2717303 RepID=UPI0029A14494|nr:TonB-dependent receptor [Haliscomenobacter sp.]MDX2069135.1 TonB-dependent receptor [Haliscomenobacter sp.]
MKTPLVLCSLLFSISFALAQPVQLRGLVKDSHNAPLEGASVQLKNTQQGTSTNAQGEFELPWSGESSLTLVVSSVGYATKEVVWIKNEQDSSIITITLSEDIQILDELIVTGVFDSRKKIESSIAITTLDTRVLERMVPNSATELLRQVPGVYTNTSRGEIYNSVVVRGMILGGNYYYVSMQEDGLPIVPAPGQFAPDGFLRADINLNRLEAVRGGTASILGANAPGGIFNYITHTGGVNFAGEVRSRVGLEGNGRNPYYRLEAGFGGPLSKRNPSLTYYIGGHYRYANGAKYPGYPLSRGGQLKGNLLQKYKNGQIQFNLKYLNDRTVQFELTPTVDFENPHPAGNFTNNSSTLNPLLKFSYPASVLGLRGVEYDTRNLNHYREIAPGLSWEHRFGKGWKVQNNLRYSDKSLLSNAPLIVFPFAVDKFYFYALFDLLGKFGTYRFYNTKTKASYGTVKQELDFSNPFFPFKFTADLNLPGAEVQPNSVFYNPTGIEDGYIRDFMNQLTLKKQLEHMGFTAGVFYSNSHLQDYIFPPAAQGFGTIENQPQFVGVEYKPSDAPNSPVYRVTDPQGLASYGNGGVFFNQAKVRQTALFFGHNWDVSSQLNLDWGFRYEHFYVEGANVRSADLVRSKGGVDGDSTTLYDNNTYALGKELKYSSPLNTFAFSVGLNYSLNPSVAFYARYSQGSKTPDYNVFYDNSDIFEIEAQRTIQMELGVKLSNGRNHLFITPFYSALDRIPQIGRGRNVGQLATFYATPKLYNKTHAFGLELEGNYTFNENWSIRASAMTQQFTADRYRFYDTRQDGPADDTLIDRSNKKISSLAPPLIVNLTPTFTAGKLYINCNWYYMGRRAANSSETFYLPAFSQFDLNLGYDLSPKVQLRASINNLFNTFGLMSWNGPTTSGLPFETFDTENFSPEKRAANPNIVYYTGSIQPRAYFLSCTFKL